MLVLVRLGEVVLFTVPVPAADGVNTVVPAVEPETAMVVGLNVPVSVEVGVMTSPDGHGPLVGVNVTVKAVPTVPEAADRPVVYAVAAAGATAENVCVCPGVVQAALVNRFPTRTKFTPSLDPCNSNVLGA